MRDRTAERRFYAAIPDALALVDAVHSDDETLLRNVLADVDPLAIAVVLAGLVDQDRSVAELLAWASHAPAIPLLCHPDDDRSVNSSADHGTRTRHQAGCRGEACVAADRIYQRERHLRRRGRAEVAA